MCASKESKNNVYISKKLIVKDTKLFNNNFNLKRCRISKKNDLIELTRLKIPMLKHNKFHNSFKKFFALDPNFEFSVRTTKKSPRYQPIENRKLIKSKKFIIKNMKIKRITYF